MEACIFAYKNKVSLEANRAKYKYGTHMRVLLLQESHRFALYQISRYIYLGITQDIIEEQAQFKIINYATIYTL